MDINFNDVRLKDFVNIFDGKLIGRAEDIIFEKESSTVKGFVVPLPRKGFSFKKPENIFIAISQIKKIGEDVILVDVRPQNQSLLDQDKLVPKQFRRVVRKEYQPTKNLQKPSRNGIIKI